MDFCVGKILLVNWKMLLSALTHTSQKLIDQVDQNDIEKLIDTINKFRLT